MPINRLLGESKIKPGDVERLNRAFKLALRSLGLVDRNDTLCDMVARKIIEIDAAGGRDPEQIANMAAQQLGLP
jgi:hypothetical protein